VKVNRRARRRALRAALSVHARRGSIAVVDAASYSEPSTSTAAKALDTLDDSRKVLVLLGADEAVCAKSFRNITSVVAMPARDAGVTDVVGARTLVVSEAAIADLESVAAPPAARATEEAA
jgi:large subunit ribosomal protein L4